MPKKVDHAKILELVGSGLGVQETARVVGCSRFTVLRVKTAHGITENHLLTPEQLTCIEEKLDDGWSYGEIHRTLGHDVDTIRRHFPGRGWTREQVDEYHRVTRHATKEMKRWAA